MAWADFADARKRYAEMPFDGGKAELPAQMGAIASSEDDEGLGCAVSARATYKATHGYSSTVTTAATPRNC
jgi:hypothetical protein